MIIRTEEFQKFAKVLLNNLYVNPLMTGSDLLELKSIDGHLEMISGNLEYTQLLRCPLLGVKEGELHATVNSTKFLTLICKMTSETVELEVKNNSLVVVGNGTYSIPLEFVDQDMYEISLLEVGEVFNTFECPSQVLNTIQNYNSKQLDRGYFSNPVQQLYYLDEKGCLTFTSGATICSFEFPSPFKVLLNNRIVKLFKIFSSLDEENLKVSLGHVEVGGVVSTRILIEGGYYHLTASCPSDTLITQVPADIIRSRGLSSYEYEVVLETESVLAALDRFLIFMEKHYTTMKLHFSDSGLQLKVDKNEEELFYPKQVSKGIDYNLELDITYLKSVLTSLPYKFVKVRFGDHQAISLVTENIVHVIPEIEES